MWDNLMSEESCDVCECSSLIATNFTLNSGGRSASARRAQARERGAQRRLDIAPLRRISFDEHNSPSKASSNMMSTEDLSFYAGNSPQGSPRPCSISPCMDMGLLSPETSPSHFTITSDNVVELMQRRQFTELDYNSMDSGYGLTNESQNCFKFVEPLGVAPKRIDINSPPKTTQKTPPKSTSCFRAFNSLSSDSIDSMDDDYMELLDMDSMDDDAQLPTHFNTIISGDIKASPAAAKPLALRRCLSLTDSNVNRARNINFEPKTPEYMKTVTESLTPFSSRVAPCADGVRAFKRPEEPIISPVQCKRYKISSEIEKENNESPTVATTTATTTTTPTSTTVRHVLRKSMSMNDANIMSALARSSSEPDLIGDFSKPFCLPLMDGRHRDLKSISSHTMAKLVRGDFASTVASFSVIDCRYPYEFEGGHIHGAKNLYTQEEILKEFVQSKTEAAKVVADNGPKRNIIVFHCEFSSERGPKLSRFLRNHDRLCNTNNYPALHYPEVYLLHGGYKEFYENYSELCDPICYRPMLDPSYGSAYKHFRAQTKSWNGNDAKSITSATGSRLVKTRSRLVL